MQRYFIIIPFAIFLNLSEAKADYLRDSIGVENLNGKKLILHQVVAKDTYYSLGRKYNVSPKEIMNYNDNKFMSLGVVIKVPTNLSFSDQTAVPMPSAPLPAANAGMTVHNPSPAAEQNTGLTEYKVQQKDNLMMLARKYGTTVNEIKRLNDLHGNNLRVGQLLKIPGQAGIVPETQKTTAAAAVSTAPVNTQSAAPVQNQYKKTDASKRTDTSKKSLAALNKPVPAAQQPHQETPAEDHQQLLVHTVASNETMYSIATKYALTMDQLKAKNNLTTNSLYVGQKLLIKGQYPVEGENKESDAMNTDTLESVKNPSLKLPPSRYGLSQMDEKGTGVWIEDKDLDSSKMLVLHRTAPIGTIMKITNPMSNRSTFAKVVGKFTENESTKDVIIVMTKAVADALGALDKKFLCNLTYSGQANEQE